MAIAYWCILIAALLPYVWVFIAKQSGERYNNHDPRSWQDKQTNPRSRRANAAQLNGFESFPAFVAGVLMAQLAGVDPAMITKLALGFVFARILHSEDDLDVSATATHLSLQAVPSTPSGN